MSKKALIKKERGVHLKKKDKEVHPMKQNFYNISIDQAMQEVKENKWEGDYRFYANKAVKEVIEREMNNYIDKYLDELGRKERGDRRNGTYNRHLLTEVGDIELEVPRTRQVSGQRIVKRYKRRGSAVTRLILKVFLLGASTRKTAEALSEILGEEVSPTTVSNIAKQLDKIVDSFHKRALKRKYRVLLFDGVVLKKKTGLGAKKRVVLVALGITYDNKKEVIDFRVVNGESEYIWEGFLNDLYNRGLEGEGVELIVTDGAKGLINAIEVVYPFIPLQRCWAHKTRNILNYVKRGDQAEVKRDIHKIYYSKSKRLAIKEAKAFSVKWGDIYPKAVKSLFNDIEYLLNFYKIKDSSLWPMVRTTNAIERRFVEVRRRTRPMGVFADKTSMERILFAIFFHLNKNQGVYTPFLMTQNY